MRFLELYGSGMCACRVLACYVVRAPVDYPGGRSVRTEASFCSVAANEDGLPGLQHTPLWVLLLRSCRQQEIHRPNDRAVFAVQVRQTHGMDFRGGTKDPIPILAAERKRGVFDQERVELKIARHSDCGFYGIVGYDTGHDQRVLIGLSQPSLQIRADESAVGLLGNNDFTWERLCFRFEVVSGLGGTIVRFGFGGVVPDMVDWATAGSPYPQQRGNVLLRLRVVAFAPIGMVDSPLNINYEERSFERQGVRKRPVHVLIICRSG